MQDADGVQGMQDSDGGSLWRRVEALFAYTADSLCRADTDGAPTSALVYGEVTTPGRLFEALRLCAEDVLSLIHI